MKLFKTGSVIWSEQGAGLSLPFLIVRVAGRTVCFLNLSTGATFDMDSYTLEGLLENPDLRCEEPR